MDTARKVDRFEKLKEAIGSPEQQQVTLGIGFIGI